MQRCNQRDNAVQVSNSTDGDDFLQGRLKNGTRAVSGNLGCDTPLASVRGAAVPRVAAVLRLLVEQEQRIIQEIESLSATRYVALTEVQGVAA